MGDQNISNFYENREIFVTGGTGFMGKVLIEKLARSCPKLKAIYVLMRSKKGKSIDERLSNILGSPLFEKLRNSNPDNLNKIIAINGNVNENNLGISEDDMKRLLNVTIVFHSAASVRFDDPMKDAILMNTRGTYECANVAKQFKKVIALVHVSTTYSNPDKFIIEEKLYDSYANWKDSIAIAENFDTEILGPLTDKYISFQPNTYTFSKNLAEHIIDNCKTEIPCVIFRPSIVISTICDPVPGWIDNFNGPVGMLIASGIGILKTMNADPKVISDFVPVDFAIKALIIAAYKRGITEHNNNNGELLQIYNCSTSSFKKVTTNEILQIGKELTEQNPIEKTLLYPSGGVTKCRYYNFIRFIVLQFSVAIIMDLIFRVANMKPFLMKLQRKIYVANCALRYFVQITWTFKNENFMTLDNLVSKSEYEEFAFMRFKNYDTTKYFSNALTGAKVYLLKEKEQCSEAGKKRFKILKFLHFFVLFVSYVILFRYFVLPTIAYFIRHYNKEFKMF